MINTNEQITKVLAWHTLTSDGKTSNGEGIQVKVGQTLRLPDGVKPVLCERGYHASVRPLDLLRQYIAGPIWCRVELSGAIIHDDDGTKSAASERTCLAMVDGTKVLQRFAIWCAEQALAAIDKDKVDQRSAEALRVAALYIDGKVTKNEMDAAYAAAAADAAANAAICAARAANADAADDAQNEKLEAMLLEAINEAIERHQG